MEQAQLNSKGELNDKIKAGFIYLSFAFPIVFYFLIAPDAAFAAWFLHFITLLIMPRIKGEGTRWTFKRQLKWIGGSLAYFVALAIILDNEDKIFCDLAPEVMAEVILRSNAENPRLLSEEISAQELMNMIGGDSQLAGFAMSINSQPDCFKGMSIFEAVQIAGTKPDFRELMVDYYDEPFSSVRRFFEENETGKHAVCLTFTYDSKNNVFVDPSAEDASFNPPAAAVIDAIKSGAGDFLDLEILDKAKISFVSELSADGDAIKLEPVNQSRLKINIDGQSLEDWKKNTSEFLTAEIQETERAAEAARIAEEKRKEQERLAEEERKRKEAEYERSIPKFTAYDIDTKFVLNAAGSAMKYNDEVVQVTGKVTSVEEGGFWSGGWEITSYVDNGRAVIFNVRDTPENKAKIMKLVAQRDMVTVRGKCDGDEYQVEIEKCDIIRVKRRF